MIVSEMTNECARNYTICCNRSIAELGLDLPKQKQRLGERSSTYGLRKSELWPPDGVTGRAVDFCRTVAIFLLMSSGL